MNKKTALIISNGDIIDYSYLKTYLSGDEFVICADGGARHAKGLGVVPDLFLGDFDSVTKAQFEKIQESTTEIMSFPPEKDFTDTELALEEAVKRGYQKIVFLAVTGTRLDHSLANIYMLKKAMDLGSEAVIINEHNEIYLTKENIKLLRKPDYKLSILPIDGEAKGVYTENLYYPLVNATIRTGPAVGISNEFTEEWAGVRVREGLLLVMLTRD